jgi:hypothetical protein
MEATLITTSVTSNWVIYLQFPDVTLPIVSTSHSYGYHTDEDTVPLLLVPATLQIQTHSCLCHTADRDIAACVTLQIQAHCRLCHTTVTGSLLLVSHCRYRLIVAYVTSEEVIGVRNDLTFRAVPPCSFVSRC